MRYRPQLTQAGRPLTFDVDAIDEHGKVVPTAIAGEHPLTLYVDRREIVTLMTLGQAPEALAIGYLRNQRLVARIEDIVAVQVDWEVDAVAVTTRDGLADLDDRMAKRTVTTGCGQGTVFGALMDEIENVRLPDDAVLDEQTYFALLDNVRKHDTVYKQAGAVHGCALAAGAEILMFVEDVGRHNAVDAIAGRDVARRHRRRRQDLLHHGSPDLRDGDQDRADGHPGADLPLRSHADGLRGRAAGRTHDDRSRDRPALPPLHRAAPFPAHVRNGAGLSTS